MMMMTTTTMKNKMMIMMMKKKIPGYRGVMTDTILQGKTEMYFSERYQCVTAHLPERARLETKYKVAV
jgi:hypothetical protein